MTEIVLHRNGSSLESLRELGVLRDTGLFLAKPDITYEQLEAIGFALGRRFHEVRFAIGDWLLLVESMFPEKFSQTAETLGISPEGMREYLRVSEKVPRSIRREKLSWSHHRAVASLTKVNKQGKIESDVSSQKQWLERAETERLSHHQLRDALREDRPPDPQVCRCCKRPL